MQFRRALAALAVVAAGCVMLTGVPFAARADKPPFITNPAGHVDTLIGTGSSVSGGQVGTKQMFDDS